MLGDLKQGVGCGVFAEGKAKSFRHSGSCSFHQIWVTHAVGGQKILCTALKPWLKLLFVCIQVGESDHFPIQNSGNGLRNHSQCSSTEKESLRFHPLTSQSSGCQRRASERPTDCSRLWLPSEPPVEGNFDRH